MRDLKLQLEGNIAQLREELEDHETWIEHAEVQLKSRRTVRNNTKRELAKLESALKSLNGRTRKASETEPAPPNDDDESIEVVIDGEQIENLTEKLAELEARNEREAKQAARAG